MKQLLLTAPLGLAFIMAAAPAVANTGTIQFSGRINNGTCPIEIVDPISGGVGNIVPLGTAITAEFPTPATEAKTRVFGMRITPGTGCTVNPGSATVNFVSATGAAGPNNDLYALRASANSASGVAVVIRDARDKTIVAHGTESKEYVLSTTQPTLMNFTAGFMSTAAMAAITPGAADSDVNFTVTLP